MNKAISIILTIFIGLTAVGIFTYTIIYGESPTENKLLDSYPSDIRNEINLQNEQNLTYKMKQLKSLWSNGFSNSISTDFENIVSTIKLLNIEDLIQETKTENENQTILKQIGNDIQLLVDTFVRYIKVPFVVLYYVFKITIVDICYFIYQLIMNFVYSIRLLGR